MLGKLSKISLLSCSLVLVLEFLPLPPVNFYINDLPVLRLVDLTNGCSADRFFDPVTQHVFNVIQLQLLSQQNGSSIYSCGSSDECE